jgi:hypothetical protein
MRNASVEGRFKPPVTRTLKRCEQVNSTRAIEVGEQDAREGILFKERGFCRCGAVFDFTHAAD